MGDVIDLFEDDLKDCTYIDVDGDIGVSMRDKTLMVVPINSTSFEVVLGGELRIYNRNELAEFIKVASILIDSEDRWLPKFDLIGHNYD